MGFQVTGFQMILLEYTPLTIHALIAPGVSSVSMVAYFDSFGRTNYQI